jgi:hypothetical protein
MNGSVSSALHHGIDLDELFLVKPHGAANLGICVLRFAKRVATVAARSRLGSRSAINWGVLKSTSRCCGEESPGSTG